VFNRVLFLFYRDLRIKDNTAFIKACEDSKEIVPLYILERHNFNKYSFEFVISALGYVNFELNKLGSFLYLVERGFNEETFEFLREKIGFDAIYLSKDYLWSFEEKEKLLRNFCREKGIELRFFEGNFLVSPNLISQTKVFTPFFKKWSAYLGEIRRKDFNFSKLNTPILELNKFEDFEFSKKVRLDLIEWGFKRLESFDFDVYDEKRDLLYCDGTSKLSAYINYGVISIYDVYEKVKNSKSSQFLRELAFREFWYHIRMHFPETRNLEFQEKTRNIEWLYREDWIRKFENAETGYPIVDAGIRCLKTEGWLHNRLRMILASFFTKTLLHDWRIGEEFFKDYLVDYDEVLNIQNWQWSASVGADPRPLRIFNPMIQSSKFDPYCEFIKKYLPELKDEDCRKIHDPLKYKLKYYTPMVDFYAQKELAIRKYKKFFDIIFF